MRALREKWDAAQAKVKAAELARDMLVVEAVKASTYRDVAEQLGVSHTMVFKIVARAGHRVQDIERR